MTFTSWDKWSNVYLSKIISFCFFPDSSSNMYLYELLCGSEICVERLKLPEKIGDKLLSVKSLLKCPVWI